VQSQTNLVQPAPFPQNKQNEPAIAQNPTDATNLVAGANDEIDLPGCTTSGCPFVTNVGLSGVYVSHDGGASWSQFSAAAGGDNTASFNGGNIHTLPGFAKLARQLGVPGLASDGDPTIAFALDGTAYYGSLAGVRGAVTNSELITVSRSTDGGQGSASATPPNGDVYVLLEGGTQSNSAKTDAQMFVKSTDGGVHFSNQAVASTVVPIPSPLPGTSFRNDSFPSVDIGPDGKIYVAWADFRSGRGKVVLTTSSD